MITLLQYNGRHHVLNENGFEIGVIHPAGDSAHVFQAKCSHLTYTTSQLVAIADAIEDINGQ